MRTRCPPRTRAASCQPPRRRPCRCRRRPCRCRRRSIGNDQAPRTHPTGSLRRSPLAAATPAHGSIRCRHPAAAPVAGGNTAPRLSLSSPPPSAAGRHARPRSATPPQRRDNATASPSAAAGREPHRRGSGARLWRRGPRPRRRGARWGRAAPSLWRPPPRATERPRPWWGTRHTGPGTG